MSDLAAKPRRFSWGIYLALLALIALIAFLPVLTMMVAIVVTGAYGCNINESIASVCEIGGTDMGYWLQFGQFSIFYIFLTFPLGVVLFVIWLIVLLVHNSRFNRRKQPA